jgi:hypothetical protein
MALDKRIDQLAATIPVLSDLLAIYDVSNVGTKKITLAQLVALLNVSNLTTIYVTATDSNVISDARLVGRFVRLVLVGGIGSGEVITTGTPAGDEIKFDNTAGTLERSYNFAAGEKITIQFICWV